MRVFYVVSLLCAMLFANSSVDAGFAVTVTQVSNNVVMSGSGSLNTTDLTSLPAGGTESHFVNPSLAEFAIGGTGTATNFLLLLGHTGPISFGTGIGGAADSFSGDFFGISQIPGFLALPAGYVSGTSLQSTATWNNQTITTLGFTPGDYSWTWGAGANADFVSLNISAVPEPGMLGACGLGLAFLMRRRWSSRA